MVDKILKATHGGVLEIGFIKIQCYVLEDGSRVIAQGGLSKALGMHRAARLGQFLGGKALKPFVSKELTMTANNVILFYPPQGGGRSYGYKATILPDICIAVLEAKKQGFLRKQSHHIAVQCEILAPSLMKIGVVALVDDAVGFIKEQFEYRQLFKEFIREQAAQYEKLFPKEFYDLLYRLYKYPKQFKKNQHPIFFAKLTRKYVYEPLAGSNGVILEMLDEKNPVLVTLSGAKKRKYKLFSFLKKIGRDTLSQHMWQLIGIGKVSSDKKEFDSNFKKTFSKNFQNELFKE